MKQPLLALLCVWSSWTTTQSFGEDGGRAAGAAREGPLLVSGVYPHLAVFNDGAGEAGIGALAPWADRLWLLTYPPHATKGSPDKLYEIDGQLSLAVRPESVGGTHANRLVHRESNQLILGPYFIDAQRNVRAANLNKLTGRMTAVARHLADPANLVYFFDMEGAIYEVNVHTLDVKLLFEKPVPGWHGKGAYTSQGRLVIANNGEAPVGSAKRQFLADGDPKDPENAGVLAEWDGKDWRVIARRQFTEVTGPGGIYGAPAENSPLWAVGWDCRSVLLMLRDAGQWHTFRLPKASHTFDPKHGWYTEWPRIREIAPNQLLLVMHGMMYDFPGTFSAANSAGIKPVCSHLRIIPDFCSWNGRLVLASDETTIMQNPMAGRSQSNLWFGDYAALKAFGPRAGWGGPWLGDEVHAGVASQPFLMNGFEQRCLHLAVGAPASPPASEPATDVTFTVEIDARGNGQWTEYKSITVPARGYAFHVFPPGLEAQWLRVKASRDCHATAYLHYSTAGGDAGATKPGHDPKANEALFTGLANAPDTAVCTGLLRPAKDLHLQFVAAKSDGGAVNDAGYFELDESLKFARPDASRADEVRKICQVAAQFEVDEASAIMKFKDRRYRLPKGAAQFDRPFAWGWPRCIRELETERNLMNVHGTFYELPREDGLPLIKPVCSHGKQISDFCTWHGMLVLSGTKLDAKPDGHYFGSSAGTGSAGIPGSAGVPTGTGSAGVPTGTGSAGVPAGIGLWFGQIDDLWKLGKPVGKGGPWLKTPVQAHAPSDLYLMTGFDKKSVQLSHDSPNEVQFTLEVDVTHHGWHEYQAIPVPAGQTTTHVFPEGYSAHWVRVKTNKDCTATAMFVYE
ncbi:MAG: hypothetical protein ABSE73_01870 [Planctomycetota bacterium]